MWKSKIRELIYLHNFTFLFTLLCSPSLNEHLIPIKITLVALQSYSPVLKWGYHWSTAGLKGVCSANLQKAKLLWPVCGKSLAGALPVGWAPWGLLLPASVQVCLGFLESICLCWWMENIKMVLNTAWRGWWPLPGQVGQCGSSGLVQ